MKRDPPPSLNAAGLPRRSAFHSPLWLLLLLPLFFTGLTMPLQSPDEPREAEIARAMFEGWTLPATLVSQDQARAEGWTLPPLAPGESPAGKPVPGSYVVPHLAGHPFLEKPPLYYWLTCAAYTIFGVHEFSTRLPDALVGFLTCVLIYAWLRRETNPVTALLAAVMLATMHRFWEFAHTAMVDMILAGAVTLGYYAYARWSQAHFFRPDLPPAPDGSTATAAAPAAPAAPATPATPAAPAAWKVELLWSALFWSAIGLAFLAKNLIGPILILSGTGIHLLYACFNRRTYTKPFLSLATGLPAVVILAGSWLWLLHRDLGEPALRELLWDNTFGRMNSGYGGHRIDNPWFYVDNFFFMGAPWTVLLPLGLLWLCTPAMPTGQRTRFSPNSSRAVLFCCWLIVPTILLSISKGKRPVYLLPMLPGQAAAVALILLATAQGARTRAVRLVAAIWESTFAIATVLALAAALLFAINPSALEPWYNALTSRHALPILDFGAPGYAYLPFGLAALAGALVAVRVAFRHPAAASAPNLAPAEPTPPTDPAVLSTRLNAWLIGALAVALFFLGLNLGGLFDFVFRHKTLDEYQQTCAALARNRDFYLLYPGEKERGILGWASRGTGLYESIGMDETISSATGLTLSFQDAVQERSGRSHPAAFVLPEGSLVQFCRSPAPPDAASEIAKQPAGFPTWPRHLYPVAVVAINDNWYWLFDTRLDVTSCSKALKPGTAAYLLVHPSQAGFAFYQGDQKLPRLWSAESLQATFGQSPDACLVVPEERPPVTPVAASIEPAILLRIRSEWPAFDQWFEEVEVVPTGANLSKYTGENPLYGPTLHIFKRRRTAAQP